MAHYFENDNSIVSKIVETKAIINNELYTFKTDNNVFSKKGLDFGTRTLLESLPLSNMRGNILDIGCGYGPIGIYLAKHNFDVDMCDINERALNLTLLNAKANNVIINAFISDIYSNISSKYNYIITNPPIRVGKKILYQILFSAKKYLKQNGHLILVVHKDQGAKSLASDLEKEYSVTILKKNKGYLVIDCQI